jgi:NAD(P)H-nitrite reductase large subunit
MDSLFDDEDLTVCFCHNVPVKALVEAIRSGATTLEEIQEKTRASTGCSGCREDVLEILERELQKGAPKAQKS